MKSMKKAVFLLAVLLIALALPAMAAAQGSSFESEEISGGGAYLSATGAQTLDDGGESAAAAIAAAQAAKPASSNESEDSMPGYQRLAIVVLVPLGIALLVCMIWKSQMKTAKIAQFAHNYIPQGGFSLTGQSDVYLYRTTSRTKIQRSSSQPASRGRK